MIKSDRQKGSRNAHLSLTNEVFCVLWSHHIQGQRLQVLEVLLDDRILKSITPVDICKEKKVPLFKKQKLAFCSAFLCLLVIRPD